MTLAEIFNSLFNGGNISRHWLIKLFHPTAGCLFYVNNNESITYNNIEYKAANFDYTAPDTTGDGASLEIEAIDHYELLQWLEQADYRYIMEVVGILNDGEVTPIHKYKHFFGTASMGIDNKISFALDSDNRLDMVFTVYKYDPDTNRGNA